MSELNQYEQSIVDRLRYGLQHNQSVTLGADEVHIPMNALIERGNRRAQPENEPLTETERTVARMIEDECMRENLATLCKGYGVTEADFFGFLYRNTPTPGKEE